MLDGERGKWQYQGSLRLEQANTHGLQVITSEEFRRSYLSLFPSAMLACELPHNQRAQFGYSRRVQCPNPSEPNPFADRADPFNLSIGDPGLLPEYIDLVELGHQKSFENKATLAITTFYSVESQTIKSFWQVIADSLTMGIANNKFLYTSCLNTTIMPVKKLEVQVSLSYRSPVVTA